MANNGDANMNTDITNFFIFFKCGSNKNGNQVQSWSCCQVLASAERRQRPQPAWAACPAEMGNGSNWASFLPAPVKAGQARVCLSPLVYEGSGAPPEHNINFLEGRRQLQFLDNTCSSFFCTQDKRVHGLTVQRQPKIWWNQRLRDAKV